MKRISILWIIFSLMLFAACDSIEDTYKEFTGDGPIRYPGKCTNISVTPGWECLRVNWNISNDPDIKHILVTCISETDTLKKELDASATNCIIDQLGNQNYVIKVQSEASDGSLSLSDNYTERPYTYEHEAVKGFTRGYSKAYVAKGHLLMIMNTWDEGIERYAISYTKLDGNEEEVELTQADFSKKYLDLGGIDTTKPITLNRRAKLAGCPDDIDFEPIIFSNIVVFDSDVRKNLQERYGLSNDAQESYAETAEYIELDHDLMSMEDLLFFSHLKKVVLGKNHYFDGSHFAYPSLETIETSEWALERLHEIYGTQVELYGDSYFPASWNPTFVKRISASQLPSIAYLPTTGWIISNSVDDSENGKLVNLLDNNAGTAWTSWPSSDGVRTMVLTIDMKKEQQINGVKIVQSANTENQNYFPNKVKVEYTNNPDGQWTDLTYVEDNTLGTAVGEATLLKAAKQTKARYLRVSVSEQSYRGQVKVSLGDIAVY